MKLLIWGVIVCFFGGEWIINVFVEDGKICDVDVFDYVLVDEVINVLGYYLLLGVVDD